MKDYYSYTYKQMATTLDRSERTIGRWLAALRKRYPEEQMTDQKGRITEDGVHRLYQYREEVTAGVSPEDGANEEKENNRLTVADSSLNLSDSSLNLSGEIPNFNTIGTDFFSRLKQMAAQDREYARNLSYQVTVDSVGQGLHEGRQQAMDDILPQVPLNNGGGN